MGNPIDPTVQNTANKLYQTEHPNNQPTVVTGTPAEQQEVQELEEGYAAYQEEQGHSATDMSEWNQYISQVTSAVGQQGGSVDLGVVGVAATALTINSLQASGATGTALENEESTALQAGYRQWAQAHQLQPGDTSGWATFMKEVTSGVSPAPDSAAGSTLTAAESDAESAIAAQSKPPARSDSMERRTTAHDGLYDELSPENYYSPYNLLTVLKSAKMTLGATPAPGSTPTPAASTPSPMATRR